MYMISKYLRLGFSLLATLKRLVDGQLKEFGCGGPHSSSGLQGFEERDIVLSGIE